MMGTRPRETKKSIEPQQKNCFKVVLHSLEMSRVSSLFVNSVGKQWEGKGFNDLAAALKSEFKFSVFLAVLEGRYATGVEAAALKEAVQEVYDVFIDDVIKKVID
jgi:hypothetical protein